MSSRFRETSSSRCFDKSSPSTQTQRFHLRRLSGLTSELQFPRNNLSCHNKGKERSDSQGTLCFHLTIPNISQFISGTWDTLGTCQLYLPSSCILERPEYVPLLNCNLSPRWDFRLAYLVLSRFQSMQIDRHPRFRNVLTHPCHPMSLSFQDLKSFDGFEFASWLNGLHAEQLNFYSK